jgi:hypothetical protein
MRGTLALAGALLGAAVQAQTALPDHWAAALKARDAARLGELARAAGGELPRGRHGMTPLHSAVVDGCEPCVDALLAAGVSPMLRRDDGGTPLHRARPAMRARLIAAGTARRTVITTTARPTRKVFNKKRGKSV